MRFPVCLAPLLFLLSLVTWSCELSAQNFEWVGANPALFNSSSSWVDDVTKAPVAGPPGAADVAFFRNNATYTVDFDNDPTNERFFIAGGDVTFRPVGLPANATRTYTLNSNLTSLTGVSSLTLTGNGGLSFVLNAGPRLNVGGSNATDSSALTIDPGATLDVDQLIVSRSTVTVDGNSAHLTTGPINISHVNLSGVSELQVLSGGQANSGDAVLGATNLIGNPGSGFATIDGPGSGWSVNSLTLNRGSMTVSNGASLTSTGEILLRGAMGLSGSTVTANEILNNSTINATSASTIDAPTRSTLFGAHYIGPSVPGEFLRFLQNVDPGDGRASFAGNVQFDARLELRDNPILADSALFSSTSTLALSVRDGSSFGTPDVGTLRASGDVTLGGDLEVQYSYDGNKGDQFTIVEIGGTRAGQFNGLGQGDIFSDAGEPLRRFSIDYLGGDGNDVVITDVSRTEDNLGFETDTTLGFAELGNVGTRDASYGVTPTEGTQQARLNTGGTDATPIELEQFLGLSPGSLDALVNTTSTNGVIEGSALKGWLTVQAGDTIEFDFNFLTRELTPDSVRNDTAFFTFDGDAHFLADTTGAFMTSGSPFDEETGYQSFSLIAPSAGTFEIGFGVLDVEDEFTSSALLVDNIHVSPIPEPATLGLALFGLLGLFTRRDGRKRCQEPFQAK